MAITEQDVTDLIGRIDQERDGWINGILPEATGRFHQDDEMSILGPFGGPLRAGT